MGHQMKFEQLQGHIDIVDRYLHGVDKRTPRVMNSWCYIKQKMTIILYQKELMRELESACVAGDDSPTALYDWYMGERATIRQTIGFLKDAQCHAEA